MAGYENRGPFPAHVRHKFPVNLKKTDRELFDQLPVGDCWIDARMPEVWSYIFNSKYVCIPETWKTTMDKFNFELQNIVASLQCVLV